MLPMPVEERRAAAKEAVRHAIIICALLLRVGREGCEVMIDNRWGKFPSFLSNGVYYVCRWGVGPDWAAQRWRDAMEGIVCFYWLWLGWGCGSKDEWCENENSLCTESVLAGQRWRWFILGVISITICIYSSEVKCCPQNNITPTLNVCRRYKRKPHWGVFPFCSFCII